MLKNGGRLAIADVVELKSVSDEIRNNVQMWVGCIAGALNIKEYEEILRKVGFKDIEITSINIYTKDIIQSLATEKKLGDVYRQMDSELLDGAFAGAHVKTNK